MQHVGIYFQSISKSKISTPIPCSVDRDDIVPLKGFTESLVMFIL